MTRLALAAALLLAATPAFAQHWTQYQSGNQTHYNSDSGWNGYGYQTGNTYWQNFSGPQGQSRTCSSYQIGGTVHTNCN